MNWSTHPHVINSISIQSPCSYLEFCIQNTSERLSELTEWEITQSTRFNVFTTHPYLVYDHKYCCRLITVVKHLTLNNVHSDMPKKNIMIVIVSLASSNKNQIAIQLGFEWVKVNTRICNGDLLIKLFLIRIKSSIDWTEFNKLFSHWQDDGKESQSRKYLNVTHIFVWNIR